MTRFLKVAGVLSALVLGFLVFVYGTTMFGVQLEGEVKKQQVENRFEAHEGSQAKIEGTIQTLQNLRKDYLEAESEAVRGALRQEAVNAANRIDDKHIKRKSEGLYKWLEKIRQKRYNPNSELETSPGS